MLQAAPGDRSGSADSGDVVVSGRITKYSETPTPAGGNDPGDFDYAHNVWKIMAVSLTFGNLILDKPFFEKREHCLSRQA
jgi:hypothetical protein